MSVVQKIKDLKNNNSLDFEKRLMFKTNCRPQPDLKIRQTSKDKNKEVHRKFRKSMYDFSEWICGCEETNSFYCFVCLLFSNDMQSLWCMNGVTDLKHLKEKIKKHSQTTEHIRCSVNYATIGRVDIRSQLDSAFRQSIKDFNENVTTNRYILNRSIDCVKFCGAFELALRGHDETQSSDNPGIFRGLIDFVLELDSIFREYLEKSTVFNGTSKTVQNDLLESMLAIVQEQIKLEIQSANFIAVQVDETADSSNKTQMVFVIRYILSGTVHERFLKFINPPGTTAEILTEIILKELETLGISKTPQKLIAQSYDGASTMSGRLGGVQTRIKEHYPSANFIHCYTHQLNLIMQKAASQDKSIKIFFANLHGFSTFFSRSPKRTAVLDEFVKVVDSRARTGADGSLQAQASRQFEVFQSRAAGARLQVVKTKTVSSSRWSGKGEAAIPGLGFEDLQLPLNPLDLSSQKSKASVGRSVSRRPPTRQPRGQNSSSSFSNDLNIHIRNAHVTAATNLHRVSRLCHQIHESAVRNAFGGTSPTTKRNSIDSSVSGVEITEIEESATSNSDVNSHSNLARTKSTSSDDIHQFLEKDSNSRSIEDLDDLNQLQSWRRTSKIRRSLQYPKTNSLTISSKPTDLLENTVSVKKIRDELEKGKRLTAALRNYSVAVDLDALDHVIQSISSSSSIERSSIDENLDDYENEQLISKPQKKRDSFVTVESLQEVRGRLRHTSSPGSDLQSNGSKSKDEESDDGIVTEESKPETKIDIETINQRRVKSYVYGMERMLKNKKPVIGTGSLESRSKLVNGTTNHKNEDWYNRRKSYGFEKVHGQEEPSSISLKTKTVAESSTDSGICRSSEIMVVPTATKTNTNNHTNGRYNSESESDVENKYNSYNNAHNGINYGNVKKMTSIFSQDDKNSYYNRPSDDLANAWIKRPSSFKENDWRKNEIKSTTITIPIVKNNNVVDLSWNDEPGREIKRHSIAVDEAKYATNGTENRFRKTSLVMNDQYLKNDPTDDDNLNNNRKQKKVLFCKTEVHFAAESGKVNIVETDEKPPPTQNFRRRRRNSGPITDLNESFNKNGLPMLHFGDSSYEKTMFGITNDEEAENKITSNGSPSIYENVQNNEPRIPSAFSVVTVNTNNTANNQNNHKDYLEEDRKDYTDNDNIKGILKNKPVKPKPYHLGETVSFTDSNSDEDSRRWGVRLRHVPRDDPTIWKSTVTVHNSYYDKQDETKQRSEQSINDKPEFQKLLRNLRPTKKLDYLSDNENRYSDSFANVRVVPAAKDSRRSSWSVADRVKLVDDIQENKVYSTKVNFGDGEAIVVQNDQSTWPRLENLSKDSKQILNKGLVVRIGRQDSASKHTVCSKMTTSRENNNTTTTTKITIDLSPSPPTTDKPQEATPFTYTKFKRSQNLHSFKSTPLVLNTLKDQKEATNKIPQQLEALKKLYEDDLSDDADRDAADTEVQQLMSRITEKEVNVMESDSSSVVSGSWSRMKAFRNFAEAERSSFKQVKAKFNLKIAKERKDNSENPNSYDTPADSKKLTATYNKYSIHSSNSKFSPIVLKKTIPITTETREQLKPELLHSKPKQLHSPLLVGKNTENSIKIDNNRQSPTKEFKGLPDTSLQTKYINENIVLRQPKRSEMTYFGVSVSPKPSKKVIQTAVIKTDKKLLEKPDLLQHHKRSPTPTKAKPRKPSPESNRKTSTSPIYENLKPVPKTPKSKYTSGKDFDSSILDELTKAADQILQAVNGYTDEDCQNRLSSDEEEHRKPLDTISETKSWKNSAQDIEIKNQQRMRPTLASAAKVRVKRTSSTSSVESLSKDRRKTSSTERRPVTAPSSKSSQETTKKKIISDSTSVKASTKARRLQRASSREALLQSHGSSSEDLPAIVEASVRKPRLIKKTKTAQLTVTNGMELKKPVRRSREEKADSSKSDDKILGSLSEIRHKTAISTITNTADKCSRDKSRDRSRTRNEEPKLKLHTKRDSSSKGTISSTSTRPTTSTNRGHHQHHSQRGTTTSKESSVTQHRISTANIKKCHRSEIATRH